MAADKGLLLQDLIGQPDWDFMDFHGITQSRKGLDPIQGRW